MKQKMVVVVDEDFGQAERMWAHSGCGNDYGLWTFDGEDTPDQIKKQIPHLNPDVIVVSSRISERLDGPALVAFLKGLPVMSRGTGLPRHKTHEVFNGRVIVNGYSVGSFLAAGLVVHGKTGRTAEGLKDALESTFRTNTRHAAPPNYSGRDGYGFRYR